jgi:hypothetical protein
MSVFVLIITACNFPAGTATPNPNDPNVVFTAAALTVQAQLTQAAPFSTPTLPPPPPTNTAVTISTAVQAPTSAPIIPPTAVCDQATFVTDVTIPDGTVEAPGATFKKTWRLQNTGTCNWSGYILEFDNGEAMSPAVDAVGVVLSGQEVDVSVTFTAPTAPGDYKSYWRIRNPAGVQLPVLGGFQGKGFFVYIKVGSAGFDLHTRASTAVWANGTGNLTFGTPDTAGNGFAMYQDGHRLEDGTSPSKILETQPQSVNNGVITGLYPSYTVASGEHFKARVGFLQPDASCGTDNVTFQLGYKLSGVMTSLGQWTKSCDGTMKSIDVDLTSLAGKSVQFVLGVKANGPSSQDMTVWVSPQIAIP